MYSLSASIRPTLPTPLLLLLLSLLIVASPITPTPPPCGSCLTPPEILPISTLWLSVFSTGGLSSLSSITTPNIQYWNEEFTYPGSPTPYTGNREELWNTIDGSAKKWKACTDIRFEIVSAWAGCDRIALRWRQRGIVSGQGDGNGNATAKPGTPVLFSGIDLLTVDLASRKVSNAETSSDRMNYYRAIGMDPFMK